MTSKHSVVFKKLSKLYHDPKDPGSLGGVERLARRARELGITKNREIIKEFLASERAYSYHKPVRKRFGRNKTIVAGIDSQWQADLADVKTIADENDGVNFLLTCIDVFSKFAWVIPIKDKSAKEMIAALKKLFESSAGRKPATLQTDKGTEFLNKQVQNLLTKTYGIEHFSTFGEKKAAVVERFNRTLKERIWRYFTSSKTKRYLDVLSQIVASYNSSVHRSIRMRPCEVNSSNEPLVWRRLYGNGEGDSTKKSKVAKYNKGDTVRINKWKGDFAKGYEPNWTEEEFNLVDSEMKQQPHRLYKLEDHSGEEIEGKFYREQIQKVTPSQEYIVEKVLAKRTNPKTKVKEVLIKWEGWPEKFNCWISEGNLNK